MNNKTFPLCPLCRVQLQPLGQIPVRTGGTSGGWHLLFGEWADVGEGIMPLDVYRCPQCSRLELYDHDFSLPGS
ncbi:MAG TPA: hypothetical protein VG324_12525 [Blastocatellia bacterium]|nr:hypothetical protein [Blastocatellia bacterium]